MSRWALDRIRRRRARTVDHGVLAAEAAAHGADSAQGWRYACEMAWASSRERQAVLDRIDATLRDHDHRLTTDLADDVARALRVERSRAHWCGADLDGEMCALRAGHTEPCRPVRPRVQRCGAEPHGQPCTLTAGHPGHHRSTP